MSPWFFGWNATIARVIASTHVFSSRRRSNVSASALDTDDADVDAADTADAADAADAADTADAADAPDAPDSPDAAQDETWPTWWTLQARGFTLLGRAAFSPPESSYDGLERMKLVKMREFVTEHVGTSNTSV